MLYDAHRDNGFRLWNKAANCFLATSYRTYPNMHGRQSNDTILENLYLELEACCTYPPSRAASTFYAVDGECLVLPAKSKMREKPCHPAQSFGLFFWLTLALVFPYSRRPEAICTVDVASAVNRATSRVRTAATSIRVQHCRPSSRNVRASFVPQALYTAA